MKVGLILYSVRNAMADDAMATVEKVGKLGYKYIEVCNHNAVQDTGCGFDIDAPRLKQAFDAFGSNVVSAHIFPFERSDIRGVLAYNQILGNRNIVNPMGRFSTYDDLMRQCETMNKTGRICREAGMNYLYHNHDHEFRTFHGKSIMEIIEENTDPDYLGFEMDTFWIMRAGLSPVETLKQFGKRVKLIHQKDFAWDSLAPINTLGLLPEEREMKTGQAHGLDGNSDYAKNGGKHESEEERSIKRRIYNSAFTEIGTGIMKIQDIIDTANKFTDATHIILEQDYTRMENQIASVEKSMESFHKFTGISWDET